MCGPWKPGRGRRRSCGVVGTLAEVQVFWSTRCSRRPGRGEGLGHGKGRREQNAGSDSHEQKRRQQPPDVFGVVRHSREHGVVIPERHREGQSLIVDETRKRVCFLKVQLQYADFDLGVFKNRLMESLEASAGRVGSGGALLETCVGIQIKP